MGISATGRQDVRADAQLTGSIEHLIGGSAIPAVGALSNPGNGARSECFGSLQQLGTSDRTSFAPQLASLLISVISVRGVTLANVLVRIVLARFVIGSGVRTAYLGLPSPSLQHDGELAQSAFDRPAVLAQHRAGKPRRVEPNTSPSRFPFGSCHCGPGPMKVFASFGLDAENQCLWRLHENSREERVLMTPKAFSVLAYLVEHAGSLVRHDELLEAGGGPTSSSNRRR